MIDSTQPLISIIIPTFNRLKLLQQTLSSILGQTFTDIEIIVVDNVSIDETENFVKSIQDPRIRYFCNNNHGIIAVNRNFGLNHARGKYVAFCDDDDLWMPHKLETQLKFFSEEGVSVLASNFIPIGEPKFFRKVLSFDPHQIFKDLTYQDILYSLNPIISSSVLIRKDFLQEIGGFDETPDFRFIEDWELWLRLSLKGKIRVLSEPMVQYRILPKKERDRIEISINMLKILEKHQKLRYLDAKTFRQAQGNCFVVIGKAFLDNHDRKGLYFFNRSLILSKGWYNKLKAIAGIFLLILPSFARKWILEFSHLFYHRPSSFIQIEEENRNLIV